jgi:thioester reductase-like protein
VIMTHALINNVSVIAKKVNESEVKLIAYISFKKDATKEASISYKILRDFVKNSLPEYMVPEQFIVIDSFILTSNGKVDRKKLELQDGKILENDENTSPENAIEERIVEMCKSLLGIRIGTNSNFFESGGHSLMAVQLVSLLLNEFNVQISLRDLFNAGTIKKISSLISSKNQFTGLIDGDAKAEEYVVLAEEANLDDDIEPLPERPKNQPAAILITGATGFIGRFLLRRLLDDYEQIKIYCLVRASNKQHAAVRLKDTLSQWDLWRDGDEDRVEAIPGDIAKTRLGLSAADYHCLAEAVDAIFHCGSSVNHFENYTTAKAANVDCVNDLLRLANTKRPKILNFISTLSIFNSQGHPEGRVLNEASPISAENHLAVNGYESSKWVAEKIISLAQNRGIPCNIYRLGLVWADSEKGRFDAQQREYRVLKSCILSSCGITDYAYDVQPVPVDYVVNAISLLAKQNSQGGQIFHIGGTEGSVINISACLDDLPKSPLKPLSWYNWIKEVQALYNRGHILPAVPFVEFGFSMDQKAFEEYQMNAAQNRILYDWKKTRDILELLGLETPFFDHKMIRLALDHILNNDLISLPI